MTHIKDYAQLRGLKDSGPFLVMGVDLATRKVEYYNASVVFSDHVPMLRVRTFAQHCVCPASHRFLISRLPHPFDKVSEAQLSWIKAIDLQPGMYIAAAPSAPLQAPTPYQGHYTDGHKPMWVRVRDVTATNIFENYGVVVYGNDNYIMNDLIHKSYDRI